MPHPRLTAALLEVIAERFRALADPGRLRILAALREGEQTVTDLVVHTGLAQASVSKHLQELHANAFVKRRREGLFVHYRLADRAVFRLCDVMCGRIEAELGARRRALVGR
jgi:ArsR family transcriptional regulator